MATQTTNLKLNKLESTDKPRQYRSQHNDNIDKIETAITADRQAAAIQQEGNTATQAIAAGQYVTWKGAACKAISDIASGDTLATTGNSANLTTVSDGYVNELSEQKVNNNEMGFIINGNKTAASSGIAIGQYAFLRNSTITGCDDGLYTAAKTIPYNTVIDSTYLSAVTEGGLNSLNNNIVKQQTVTGTTDAQGAIRLDNLIDGTIVSAYAFGNVDNFTRCFMSTYGFNNAEMVLIMITDSSGNAWKNKQFQVVVFYI